MLDRKWHYPQKGEYPVIYGEYEHKHYPQIPCLVFHRGMYGVRFWNCTEECWDDEECDDFYCPKEEVEKWMYIDSLEQEQPFKDLEEAAEVFSKKVSDGHNYRDLRVGFIGGAEWQKEQILKEGIEGEVTVVTTKAGWRHSFQVFVPYDGDIRTGQQVIIIIKEDKK